MKRVQVILRCYRMAAVMGLLLAGLTSSVTTPTAQTNPPLGTYPGRINISQDAVATRAEAALREAGFTREKGGTVTIEIRPGQKSYTSTTRNGVTSRRYGAYGGSYVFVRAR